MANSQFEVGLKICEALGLDPNTTKAIDLRFSAGEVATVTVTVQRLVTKEQAQDVEDVLTHYRLHLEPVEHDDD